MRKLTSKERKNILEEAENNLQNQQEQMIAFKASYTPIDPNTIEEEHRYLCRAIDKFCQSLWDLQEFDQEYYLGFSGEFSIENTGLVTWLSTTQYKRVAMFVSYIMKKEATEMLERLRYRPAQDYLAELWSEKSKKALFRPHHETMPAEEYIETILNALTQVKEHIEDGHRIGLRYLDEIILHDELYGGMMDCFIPETMAIAHEIFVFISENAIVEKSEYNFEALSWFEQPESLRQEFDRVHELCAEKFREIGKKYYPDGRLNEGSLAFSYLMAHAEDAMWGNWREEDDAL